MGTPDNLANRRIAGHLVRPELKFTRHLEHQPVLNMHEAGDFFDTFASRVAHQSVHQVPAKPITLQGRSDQNTELAFYPIGIQNETRYAEQFPVPSFIATNAISLA